MLYFCFVKSFIYIFILDAIYLYTMDKFKKIIFYFIQVVFYFINIPFNSTHIPFLVYITIVILIENEVNFVIYGYTIDIKKVYNFLYIDELYMSDNSFNLF